jgi:hypothetical protein
MRVKSFLSRRRDSGGRCGLGREVVDESLGELSSQTTAGEQELDAGEKVKWRTHLNGRITIGEECLISSRVDLLIWSRCSGTHLFVVKV